MSPVKVSGKVAWLVSLLGVSVALIGLRHRRTRKKDKSVKDRKDDSVSAVESNEKPGYHSVGKETSFADSVELPPHIEREIWKEQRRQAKVPMLARKTPMYDNVRMLDPDGELLCTISAKKGRWYVKKGLARWTDDSSQDCVKLNFEPKCRSNRGDDGLYARSEKRNVCVSCGDDNYHMRHYVVPYAYRSRLPSKYKSHLSHDVVILCPDCHLHCEQDCQKRMKEIEDNFREESGDEQSRMRFITDPHLYNLRSSALALLRWKHKIPESKVATYEEAVRTHLNVGEKLTADQLQSVIDVDYRVRNPHYVAGAELVVQALDSDDVKIEHFVRGWRRHFVDTVQPRHLPEGWHVDSPVASDDNGIH